MLIEAEIASLEAFPSKSSAQVRKLELLVSQRLANLSATARYEHDEAIFTSEIDVLTDHSATMLQAKKLLLTGTLFILFYLPMNGVIFYAFI